MVSFFPEGMKIKNVMFGSHPSYPYDALSRLNGVHCPLRDRYKQEGGIITYLQQ